MGSSGGAPFKRLGAETPGRSFGPGAIATPANLVTLLRVAMAPVMAVLILDYGANWGVWAAWTAVSVSDTLDGYLARKHGTTRSGAFLDPLADKALALGALGALVVRGSVWWLPVALVAGRELFISLYRSVLGRRGVSVPAKGLAKLKTWTQDSVVGFALMPPVAHRPDLLIVPTVMWLAVALTLWTGVGYLRRPAGAVG